MRVPTAYHVPKTHTRKLLVIASTIVCLVVTGGEQRLLEQTHRQLAVSLKHLNRMLEYVSLNPFTGQILQWNKRT